MFANGGIRQVIQGLGDRQTGLALGQIVDNVRLDIDWPEFAVGRERDFMGADRDERTRALALAGHHDGELLVTLLNVSRQLVCRVGVSAFGHEEQDCRVVPLVVVDAPNELKVMGARDLAVVQEHVSAVFRR